MTNKQRRDRIERFIRENRYADLHTLSSTFDISLSTVRRVLNDLEAEGIVRRHHGGASLVEEDAPGGYDFILNDDNRADEKHTLAEEIAGRIEPGMTVMLDGGTTTYAVARLLTNKRIIVVTNSLPIAALFNEVSACETVVTGGTLYNRLGVLYGPTCENSLAELHADLAVLGCAGVTAEGIWNSNAMIASYQRRMIAACSRTCFAADASKLGKRALTLATSFKAGMTLITTASPEKPVERALTSAGGELRVVSLKARRHRGTASHAG
ncbi:MAG: DeoR/GlpR transcriptional regulator [Opitutales bacterium]|nr:DeoR/GlpR transcriptional regulator [Opitutales bacterium]